MDDKIPDMNLPERVLKTLSQFNTLLHNTFSTDLNADVQPNDPQAVNAGFFGDIASQITRLPEDIKLGMQLLDVKRNEGLDDDKKYMLENMIKFAASLPSDSSGLKSLSSGLVDVLWSNLQHPPLSYLGDEWRFRTADGSNNNRMYPNLGAAGSPYARTVAPKVQLPPTLPDAGMVFDELFARTEEPREHPNKISSNLFYLATLIIHDIFRTNEKDWTQVSNSSYLDLQPLYGKDITEQTKVRSFKDGKLKPDAFAEVRLLGFPPGVCAMLVLFNRFHNYIATELASINEAGRFTLMDPVLMSDELKDKYKTPELKRDNDLFQTARLITCGLYINIILIDYVRTILNLNHSHSEWSLDPRANSAAKAYGPSNVPEGIGNQVSVEFNLLYRWHSTISKRDEQWTKDFFKNELKTPNPHELSVHDLRRVFHSFFLDKEKVPEDPGARTFGGLKRQANGAFNDEDLCNIISDSTEDVASAFGARQVPTVMRVIEIMGINQARNWNVATLNEFRQYFGLIPHKTFEDINSDPEVAKSLETLYGDPSKVELYPGLVAEEPKKPQYPGSGLCPGFTASKAILSDAVGLVRGDRFYTVDYNAATLTNWGFNQAASDKTIAEGGVFYKLIMRALPGFHRTGSVYAMYPFTTPDRTYDILKKLGKAESFDFSRPKFVPQPKEVNSWKAVVGILKDPKNFKVPWGPHTSYITGHDYMLSGDEKANIDQHSFIEHAIYSPRNGLDEIRDMYEKITSQLVCSKARFLRSGCQLDVVADVANLSHAMAVAELFHVSVKTSEDHIGVLTPQAFYTIMSVLFAYVFLDLDPASSFKLRAGAKQSSEALGKIVQLSVEMVQNEWWSSLKKMLGRDMSSDDLAESYGTQLIRRLSKGGKSAEEVTWAIVPTMAASVATQAQGLSQMLDLLLSEPYYSKHWPVIQELAQSDDPKAFAKLEKYALECYRLNTPASGLLRNVAADNITVDDNGTAVKLKKDDKVLVNFVKAGIDKDVFPDPLEIRLDRDPSLYIHHGVGTHACVGRKLTVTAMAAQLRVFGRLKNFRRAPGEAGQLKKKVVNGAFKVYMKPDWSDYWPFPTTMKVLFDAVE